MLQMLSVEAGLNIMKMNITLLFFMCTASLQITFATLTAKLEPQKATFLEGETLTAMCSANQPISWCGWSGTRHCLGVVVKPGINLPERAEYYGKSIEKGECGIRIPNITEKYNGIFTCKLVPELNDFENHLTNNITIVIAKAPRTPKINVTRMYSVNYAHPEKTFEENKMIQAECTIEYGRPAANISWFIGTKRIKYRLSSPKIDDLAPQYEGQQKIMQTLTRKLKYLDNGKDLRCVANHIALGSGTLTHPTYKLNVYFKPRRGGTEKCVFSIGKPGKVVVMIYANPEPNIEWFIDGHTIREGATHANGRFRAGNLTAVGQASWNAVLDITEVRPKDVAKRFVIIAGNILGQAELKGLFCPEI